MIGSQGRRTQQIEQVLGEIQALLKSLQEQRQTTQAQETPAPQPAEWARKMKHRYRGHVTEKAQMERTHLVPDSTEAPKPETEQSVPVPVFMTPDMEEKPAISPPPLPEQRIASFVEEKTTVPGVEEKAASSIPPLTEQLLASFAGKETATPGAEEKAAISPPPLPEQLLASFAGKRTSPTPPQNTWLNIQLKRLQTWLFKEGNIWVTAGVLTLLVGFGLLFNFMAQMGWFSLELRLANSAAVGIAMTAFGWRMREEKRTYGLILQGGGIGVLYIVFLAGAKLGGGIIPIPVAVAGMLILSVFTVILALLQDFEPLALFALLGGYAAPPLVSMGGGNHIALFSIYSMLNLEILALSTRRDWRKTRWGGMTATLLIGIAWGLSRWSDAYFASVEPFIILFFLTFSAIACIPFSPRFAGGARFDFPLTLTLPFAFLALQMGAASHTKYGIAITCLGMGAWYLALGQFALKKETSGVGRKLPGIFLGFCILFANLAIPFIFKQAVSSAVWAIEGAFLIVLAKRNSKQSMLGWGIVLHVAACILYNFAPYMHLPQWLYDGHSGDTGLLSMYAGGASPFLLTGLLFAASSLISSYFVWRCKFPSDEPFALWKFKLKLPDGAILSRLFAAYGTIWWWLSINNAASFAYGGWGLFGSPLLSSFAILSLGGAAAYFLSQRLAWRAIRTLMIPPVMLILFRQTGFIFLPPDVPGIQESPIGNWLFFLPAFLCALFAYRNEKPENRSDFSWGVILFAWLFFTNISFGKSMGARNEDWAHLISFLPVLGMTIIFTRQKLIAYCRMEGYEKLSIIAIAAIMALEAISLLWGLSRYGQGGASFYIPLLNPLELWQAAFLTTLFLLFGTVENLGIRKKLLFYAFPAIVFLWLNQIAARAAWHYFHEFVRFGSIGNNPNFQAIIAILWGLTSLALIFVGEKRPNRTLWFMGAGLLALDIVKLMLIDLQNSATIIRIFAFLLLGGLFLLIGWLAPLPPKHAQEAANDCKEAS